MGLIPYTAFFFSSNILPSLYITEESEADSIYSLAIRASICSWVSWATLWKSSWLIFSMDSKIAFSEISWRRWWIWMGFFSSSSSPWVSKGYCKTLEVGAGFGESLGSKSSMPAGRSSTKTFLPMLPWPPWVMLTESESSMSWLSSFSSSSSS